MARQRIRDEVSDEVMMLRLPSRLHALVEREANFSSISKPEIVRRMIEFWECGTRNVSPTPSPAR